MSTYAVTTRRVEDWWAIEVPELGIHTQSRRLDQVEDMARDAIALTLDIDLTEVELGVNIRLDEDLESEWYQVQGARYALMDAQRRATEQSTAFARRLVEDEGLRLREVAYMLGISHQRVSQMLEADAKRRRIVANVERRERARQRRHASTAKSDTDASRRKSTHASRPRRSHSPR